MLDLLKRKDFTLYILGNVISKIGSDMLQFALGLYVLEQTGSATTFASVLSVIVIPRLLLSPISGVIADRVNRKTLLIGLNISNALVILLCGWYYSLFALLPLWLIYILVIYLEMIEVLYAPASSAVFPSILDKDQLADANSLTQSVLAMSGIVSPLIAAFAYQSLNMQQILFIVAISYIAAALGKVSLILPYTKPDAEFSFKVIRNDIKSGIKYFNDNPVMWKSIINSGAINMFIAPAILIVWPYFVREVLGLSSVYLGYTQAIMAVGMVFGGLLSMLVNKRFQIGTVLMGTLKIIALLFALETLAIYVLYYTMSEAMLTYYVMTTLFFLLALSIVSVNVAVGTFIQKTVPLRLIGRISTVAMMIAMGAIPFGNLLYGVFSDRFPVYFSYAFAAVAVIIIVIIFRTLDKELNHYVKEKIETID